MSLMRPSQIAAYSLHEDGFSLGKNYCIKIQGNYNKFSQFGFLHHPHGCFLKHPMSTYVLNEV